MKDILREFQKKNFFHFQIGITIDESFAQSLEEHSEEQVVESAAILPEVKLKERNTITEASFYF